MLTAHVGSEWVRKLIVSFQEGDPSQPLMISSVYNARQVPLGKLPYLAALKSTKPIRAVKITKVLFPHSGFSPF
ncbi:hypothetical protein [Conservatibacter flavescens]|uniref:Uncharacterized protein n=1 Tax=Conservatibacter flavescens TaxID=28161 RepID=A0A2M8S2W6_9PAST|nr:hypothetical protein [Conservatibacter flavescens]PJG85474.1 hypothetical protein CVP05_05920 [Conservatibacter flavescens]